MYRVEAGCKGVKSNLLKGNQHERHLEQDASPP